MTQKSYYWAEDKKVFLEEAEEWIAVDFARLGQLSKSVQKRIATRGQARPVRGMIQLISRGAVPDDVYAKLEREAAILPVFRHGSTLLVAYPEVRVDVDRTQRKKIQDIVKENPQKATITEERGNTVVLRPTSGRGADAITLANSLYESVHPRMAQARFLRIIPRPDVRGQNGPRNQSKGPTRRQTKFHSRPAR